MLFKRLTLVVLAVALLLAGACQEQASTANRIDGIARPHEFSLFGWEVRSLTQELRHLFAPHQAVSKDDAQTVVDYFSLIARRNGTETAIEAIQSGVAKGDLQALRQQRDDLSRQADALEEQAEDVLEAQVRQAMADQGINHPFGAIFKGSFGFPPVQVSLEEPPKLLVISPRDKIERTESITLDPGTSLADIEAMEEDVTRLGYSALVVDLGGIATYPSFVTNDYGLHGAVNTAVHEWVHQYLFFRPLGFRYGLQQLGINEPADIMIMNETVADMVGTEVGDIIYDQYYRQYEQPAAPAAQSAPAAPGIDFNATMRQLRTTVDQLLSAGKVNEAEAYMEQTRLYLAQHGYFIRKLNQAYFAFYGSYASNAAFSNPIGDGLRQLREQSATLADFVNLVGGMSSRADLDEAVKLTAPIVWMSLSAMSRLEALAG